MSTQKTNIWIDGTQAGATYAELKKSVNALNKEIRGLARNSDEYKSKVAQLAEANTALKKHRDEIRGVSDSYKPAENSIKSLLGQFAPAAGIIGVATMALSGVGAAVSSWYNNNKQLEKSLSSLKSLTGASAQDIKYYKEEAIALGKSTTLSATQVVDAYKVIGGAKPELLANKQALNDVTKETITLAEAAEMELEPAAQAVTGMLNQYDLAATETSRAVNVLAAGSQAGSAEITDLSAAIDKSGAVLNGYNVSIEGSVGLLETMAEKNIKGAEAGTQLRNVILTMQGLDALPANATAQLEKYGVSAEIVTNKQLPLNDRLKEMSKVAGDSTAMMQIFGKENIVAASSILNNVDKVQELTDAVTGTNTAYEQQRINNDNLDGDLKSLSSAWEGFTLSVGGAGNSMRGLVQLGTGVLNWTSDTITAFKEMDGLKIETQFLKLASSMPFAIGPLQEYLEQQIRINEITSELIETTRRGAEEIQVLTGSLMANNETLKDSNITQEQRNSLDEQNARIIEELNERFPELTANVDFHKITTAEMNTLQKAMNETMVEQAVQTAKVAEQEKLLQKIIETTIEKQRFRAAASNKEFEGVFGNFKKAMAYWDNSSNEKELLRAQKNLQNLDKDFSKVEKTIKNMNLNAGSSYQVHANMAADANRQIEMITSKMQKVTDPAKRKALEAQLKGLKATVGTATRENKAALDALLAKTEETVTKEGEFVTKSKEAFKKQQEAKKKHIQEMEKLQKQLTSIIENAEKYKKDLTYEKKLAEFKDEQEKELFILQNTIDSKYEKEINAAQELAKQKGEIGVKASEQVQILEQIKAEEFNLKRLEIESKFQTKKEEEAKKSNENQLKQRESLEDSLIDLRVAKAQIALQAVDESDKAGRAKAEAELLQALDAQLERENEKRKAAYQLQFENKEISQQELDAKFELSDLEHKSKLEAQHATHIDKLSQMDKARVETTLNSMSEVINLLGMANQIAYNNEINDINDAKQKRMEALDEALAQNLISQEEYTAEKEKLDASTQEKEKALKNEMAEKEKKMAIAQATIASILAVLKASPNPVAMAFAALTGAANVALVASTPIPQYKDGGFADVIGGTDGQKYRAKYIGRHAGGMLPNTPSLMLASEEGTEYFVPHNLLRDTRVISAVNTIEAIRTNQYADGGFTQTGATPIAGDPMSELIAMNTKAITMLVSILPQLKINFGDQDIENLEKRQSELDSMR